MEQYTEKCEDVYNTTAPAITKPNTSIAHTTPILLTDLAMRNRPYPGLAPSVVLAGVSVGTFRPSLPDSVPPAIAALAAACWSHDPRRRPAFAFRAGSAQRAACAALCIC